MVADSTSPLPSPPRPWRPSLFLRLSLAVQVATLASVVGWPRHRRLAASLLALDTALLATVGMLPRSRLLGANLTRLPASKAAESTVSLTFDDGPDPAVTPRVLDLLAHHDAGATFFLIGRRAERAPELVREIIARGHQIGNHTYRHANTFALGSPRAMGREIDHAQRVLSELSGRAPIYFRPPAGIRNLFLEPMLARRGLHLAAWTRRGYDAVARDPAKILARLTRNLAAGDILLLHDGSAARSERGVAVSLEVLPRLLDILAERRLRSMPLPVEGSKQKRVTVYGRDDP